MHIRIHHETLISTPEIIGGEDAFVADRTRGRESTVDIDVSLAELETIGDKLGAGLSSLGYAALLAAAPEGGEVGAVFGIPAALSGLRALTQGDGE